MTDAPPPSEYLADQKNERLDVFLARRLPGLSRTQARRWIDDGLVRVENTLERASYRLGLSEMVRVWSPTMTPAPAMEAQPMPLDILYEDHDVIVVNKPVGLAVHPAPGHPSGTLVNALLAHCPDLEPIGNALRPGIVQRLDKDTSGVMVVAKNELALRALQDQIQAHEVEKVYQAVVAGLPDPLAGTVDAPIGRNPVDRTRMAVVGRGGRRAQTQYRVLESFADTALLECRLITGRTHQIRVHMAAVGHPILGDAVYGQDSDLIDRQALHARRLGFRHPRTGDVLRLEAPLPPDLLALLARLREQAPMHGRDVGGADTVGPRPGGNASHRKRHRARHVR